MNRKEISRFTIGGTTSGPSVPDEVMQRALGSTIRINTWSHTYHVPTPDGPKIACKGDTIIAYDDGSFDVEFVKKDYRIAVTWGMRGFVDVEANSLEEAI